MRVPIMNERASNLLIGFVTEYIRTGQPVGSVALARALHLDRSPATVRSDLHELEEAGYMQQPHTSAGRIPTDLGYRFFVNHVRCRQVALAEKVRLKEEFHALFKAHDHLARATARFLAQLTEMPALSYQNEPPDFFESGLRELVQESSRTTLAELKELSALLQRLDERLNKKTLPASRTEACVYIGEEIPFMPARLSSIVVRAVVVAPGRVITLVILGPKRMPYQRNVSLLNAVAEIIENQAV